MKKRVHFGKVSLPGVRMANGGTSGFTQELVSAAALSAMETYLAPLLGFSTDFSSDFRQDGDSVKVEVINSVGEVKKNLTDWDISDLSLGMRKVSLTRYSRPAALTYAERKNGVKLTNKIDSLVKTLANGIFADICATLKDSTAVNTLEVDAASAFTPTVMTDHVWASIQGGADIALLRQEYFARLIPKDQIALKLEGAAYQMANGVHNVLGVEALKTGNKGVGFAARSSGLCVATRLPEIPDDVGIRQEIVTSDKLGISMIIKYWGSAGQETQRVSAEILFGCTLGIGTHITKLVQKDSVSGASIPGLTAGVEPVVNSVVENSTEGA